ALVVSAACLDYVLRGLFVAVSAGHETRAGLFDGFTGLWRSRSRWRRRSRSRGLGSDNGELAAVRDPILLDANDAIDERGQELGSLGQGKLKQLTLREGRHDLCFPELTNKRGVGWHVDVHKVRTDRQSLHVNRRLTVDCES